MPERRSLAEAVTFCVLCGMTLVAIGIAVAAAYGAIGQAALAAALGLVAIVQLAILAGNWRRAALIAVADEPYAALQASPATDQDRREEPDMATMTSSPAGADYTPADTAEPATDEPATDEPTTDEPTTDEPALFDEDQLDLHLEPVVELAATRTAYYRANLAMTRQDGSRIGAYLLSLSAGRGGYAPALDLALFRRVCPVIRHLKARSRRPGVFCPLSPQSFAERGVLDELVAFLKANEDAAGAMVIELSQADLAALSPAGMEGLAYLAELGATLSLREARLACPDPATLALLGFRFFDLDFAALASTHGWEAFDENGDICRLACRVEDAGLTVIAANVAGSDQLKRVRAFARLARGPLFSPPRIVRRDLTDLPVHAAAA